MIDAPPPRSSNQVCLGVVRTFHPLVFQVCCLCQVCFQKPGLHIFSSLGAKAPCWDPRQLPPR